jgi:transcription-repair coupling factor (superfamily II helicase)
VLGAEQHGHLAAVGFDLYCELVEEAARELKGGFEPPPRAVVIDVKLDAFLPPRYVADERERIALYRRMNLLATQDEVAELKEEFKDRYGPVPKEVETLLKVLLLKIKARPFGIKSIKGDASQVVVDFTDSIKSDILQNKIRKLGQRAKVAGKKLNYEVAGLKIDDWITNLQNIFA